jgi:uncharacterized NAD(P)/FAD-binding protein YdhS
LERIAWLARLRPGLAVSLDIFEPGAPGTGCHAVDQPEYLKLNTIACQLSMFPDDPSLPLEEQRLGPSLYQWCKLQGILVMDEHQMTGSIRRSRPVRPNDFLPRKILGQYLVWFHRTVMANIPANLRVKLHTTTAVSIDMGSVLDELRITGADGASAVVDRAFITIGHACNSARSSGHAARTIPSPYPLPGELTRLAPDSTIIIRGLGLSAMDIMMAAITEWGGRFELQADALRYFPSGREGKLIFSSRAGLPYLARPVTTEDHKRVEARFLTSETIQQLKKAAGPGKLDFEHSVLPLMRLEMQAAYYSCLAAQEGQLTAESVARELARAVTIGRALDAMQALAERWGPYEPDRYLQHRAPRPQTGNTYRNWLIHQLREDIQESRAGVAASPLKAAIEVWRDLRDSLREIIDGGSLSPESRLIFFRDYAPMINRLVAGPQWERSAELLCLIESEIADVVLASESGEIHLDGNEIHVDAYVGSSGAARTDSPLLCNLVKKGIAADLRSTAGIDGIAVTAEGDVISPEGVSASKLWLFGPAAEGATYYNHYIPSPGRLSRAQRDAQTAVKSCLLMDPTSKFVSVQIDAVSDAAE